MKARFTVSPTIQAKEGGLAAVETDMLLLTQFRRMAFGPEMKEVDQGVCGQISKSLKAARFDGELVECVHIELDAEQPQNHVLVVGLGASSRFDACSLMRVIETAVDEAVAHGCTQLSIPLPKNRLSGSQLNLRGTAHLIRQAAVHRLSTHATNKLLKIQIVCTTQAKRFIEEGLAIPCRHKALCCCAESVKKPGK